VGQDRQGLEHEGGVTGVFVPPLDASPDTHMIYMVENGFADPSKEAAWNDWYTGHMTTAFRNVPGWRTGQRFRVLPPGQPKYRAMYTIDSADVMTSAEYKATTGGRFPPEWRDCVPVIRRNLADGEWMPAVAGDRCLVVVDEPGHGAELPRVPLQWWNIVGLDRTVDRRAIAVVSRNEGETIAGRALPGVAVYEPLIEQYVV
jgi:hypothetical protein